MSSSQSPPRFAQWSYALIALYAVVGHFVGQEYSRLVGGVLALLGLLLGWWVAAKLAHSSAKSKVLALVAPIALAGLLGVLHHAPASHGLRVNRRALDGTWVSQGSADTFTVRLAGDSAWLSITAGLQNAAYHAAIHNDSLVLSADETNVLRWGIARDTTRHALVLVAGDGLYFLKVTP